MLDDQFYRDMRDSHSERMQNLMKYYPFFALWSQSLNQYKDGKYAGVDMAYVTMAVLRFFIEENHFHDRPVTYGGYTQFMLGLLERDFDLGEDTENKELASFLFDKLKNDGKPFEAQYFDPADRKRKTLRMRLFDSAFLDGAVVYTVTSDAIAFYLDTKEIKEESKITMEQLLLEKMITNRNFKGGIEVVRRINSEVNRLRVRKQEVLRVLSLNVFEGVKALEEFNRTGIRWFEEEQNAFARNKEQIVKALEKTQEAMRGNEKDEKYREVFRDIYQLDTELKKAMTNHGRLLADCTQLLRQADERIRGYKFSRLRPVFDFGDYLRKLMEADRVDLLSGIALGTAAPAIRKMLPMENLADLLSCPGDREELPEKEEDYTEEVRRFDDEIEEERIGSNYRAILKTLLDTLLLRGQFDLITFNQILELKFFDDIFRNSDYYSFLVHICQKREYDMERLEKKPETFLEEILAKLPGEDGGRYRGLRFRVEPDKTQEEDGMIRHVIAGAERDSEFVTSNLYFTRL